MHVTIQLETIIILILSNINRPTDALDSVDVVLLHSSHQHVLASHVAIFRVVRERIQILLIDVSIIPQFEKKCSFWLKFTVE